MDDQLLSEFLAEADDLIEALHGDIATLRARRTDGRARRELVGGIFRRVHTIKGTASAAGLAETSRIAHEFETLLDAVRLGHSPVDDAALDAAQDAVAAVAASLGAVARGEPQESSVELIERLRRLASAGAKPTRTREADAAELLPAEFARALGKHERQRLREAVNEGAQAYVVAADFDLEDFDEEFRRLSAALGEFGEVVAAQPVVDMTAPERVAFRIIYASAEARDGVDERVKRLGARLWGKETISIVDDGAAEDEDAREEELDDGAALLQSHAPVLKTLVRVPLGSLDDLISTTHELFADTDVALDLAVQAGEGCSVGREDFETRVADIRRRFFELEEGLKGLRTVAARVSLERAARAGRSVARSLGKVVGFEIEGGNVLLDKLLADALADPLLHLVRNAVAHGIETAEVRRASGKPERGRVRLEAIAEDGVVLVRVSDDGRGVDTALIAEAASVRGLIAPGATLSDAHALRLIFRPGFSTAARVSLASGRGVGLDVVERAVQEAGGEVSVRTENGRGATFEMRMPTKLTPDT